MSIFDRMPDEELQRRLMQPEMGQTYNMQGGPARNPNNANTYGITQNTGKPPPIMPKAPQEDPWKRWIGDPSGFVNAGMEAPELPGPMAQLKGLMSMAPQQQQRQQQQPQGGLMAYLMSLGGM